MTEESKYIKGDTLYLNPETLELEAKEPEILGTATLTITEVVDGKITKFSIIPDREIKW